MIIVQARPTPAAPPKHWPIECYWGHLKPTLVARHRSVSPKHLSGYLVESDYKHNLAPQTDFVRGMLHFLLKPAHSIPFK
ncbi:MAG: hypothetical protein ACREUA_01355 [Burkholderiales bacterium]